jgi:hypothetical protein
MIYVPLCWSSGAWLVSACLDVVPREVKKRMYADHMCLWSHSSDGPMWLGEKIGKVSPCMIVRLAEKIVKIAHA